MPKIKEYTNQTNVQGPVVGRRVTVDDLGLGRSIESAGSALSDVGSALQHREQQAEISETNAKVAKAHADWTNHLGDTLRTADPADRNLTDKFMGNFDDYMSKISENISTPGARNYFTKASAELRAHFLESATAGQAQLAGEKAKADYHTTLNSYSSSLVNNPSSFDMVKRLNDMGLDTMVKDSGLPEEAAIKLKTISASELAKSSVKGWIKINPDYAQQVLDSAQMNPHINGDQKAELYGEIKVAKNAAFAEQERVRREQERIKGELQMKTQNDFIQKLTDNKLSTSEVLNSNLDPVGSGSKEHYINAIKVSSEQKIKTDPEVFVDLLRRIHLPDGDPQKLWNENDLLQYTLQKKLSFEDLNHLRDEAQGKRTVEGQQEFDLKKGTLQKAYDTLVKKNPMLGLTDPIGEENYQRFVIDVQNKIKEFKQEGKPVKSLFDPDSKDYIGKQIANYQRTPQQIIKDISANMAGKHDNPLIQPNQRAPSPTPAPLKSVTPRQPNESPADYLKRIGG